ncbi:MAG: sulfotransferase family 2 domain-containing protein [Methyloceanibacter sp.]|uniref:sulfotransferase family 2 domain-containing protein n=1 Tax=Methyloceanibacter sp. TaxID=1965321 RepID=UPI003D6D8E1A
MSAVTFIHIRKTGGSAIKSMLRGDSRFALHSHDMTLPLLWREAPDTKVFFVVRDPVERFVSGFYSRLRKAPPARDTNCRPEEAMAFTAFPTANSLAEALSSTDRWERMAAALAMHAINHVKHPLHLWLRASPFLERHKGKILFVGWTNDLDRDLPELRDRLDLEDSAALPSDDESAHRGPKDAERSLSNTARRNIAEWYKADRETLDWCLKWRAEQGLA